MLRTRTSLQMLVIATAVALALPLAAQNAQPPEADADTTAQEEHDLIAVLESDAEPFEKDVACRRLAIIGTKAAVPALAALLTDEKLCGIARLGLESIPDPSVDEALRTALPKVKGRRLVGVVTSIGNRGDSKALAALTRLLQDDDAQVAGAAASSLGKIGGPKAAKVLGEALRSAPDAVRPAVGHACLWCAKGLMADGKRKRALALLERLRDADVPEHIIEAAALAASVDGDSPEA